MSHGILALLLIFFSWPAIIVAQSREGVSLFGSDSLLDISLTFDLTAFIRHNREVASLPAMLKIYTPAGDTLDNAVNISTRGTFRLAHCTMPPMEISFKKPVMAYEGKGPVRKIKLVSTCELGGKNDEYVLREYLVYRMFNIISDSSYRVRLLRVKYYDTGKSGKDMQLFGFFIEPKAILAERVGSVVIENMNLNQKYIEMRSMDKVAIFNYMVGNWDWAVQSLHNITVLKSLSYTGTDLGIAVPYDFDLTGIVDPFYNTPPSTTGLKSNRDRRYMGTARNKELIKTELAWFLTRKEKLYDLVSGFSYLDNRARKDIINYLDSFFSQVEHPRLLDNLADKIVEAGRDI